MELRGHSSLSARLSAFTTVKRLRTAVQHVITAMEKEARLTHEGETKSDAGQTDHKSSENFRG